MQGSGAVQVGLTGDRPCHAPAWVHAQLAACVLMGECTVAATMAGDGGGWQNWQGAYLVNAVPPRTEIDRTTTMSELCECS